MSDRVRSKVFTLRTIRKNPALIPLIGMVGVLGIGISMIIMRTLIFAPEVQIVKRDTEPWEDYRNKQYSLFNPKGLERDKCPAPKF